IVPLMRASISLPLACVLSWLGASPLGAAAAEDRQRERDRMVEEQIIRRGIAHQPTLEAMRAVPRHLFVPDSVARSAYADSPLPIGHGQTISQPLIVAFM